MQTLKSLYQTLKTHCDESDARWVLQARLNISWSDIIGAPDTPLSGTALKALNKDIARMKNGEPLSRILGVREFWGLEFHVSPDTLDPRGDTEVIVQAALDHFGDAPPQTVLDLGTGTGCMLIALLHEWKNARGVGVDISSGACDVARMNADRNYVGDRAEFITSNWCGCIAGTYECIVSNPPYIRADMMPDLDKNVTDYDPERALIGGADGLEAYRTIFESIPRFLSANGRGFFEFGYDQADDVAKIGHDNHLNIHRVIPDYAGHTRGIEISYGDK